MPIKYDAAMVRRLWEIARRHVRLVVLALGLSSVFAALTLLPPQLARVLIDDYQVPQRREFLSILVIIGSLAVTHGLISLANTTRWQTMARLSNALSSDLRRMVYTNVQKLSLR